jgi:hypothetical protein
MIVSINFIDSDKNYARMSSCYMKAFLTNIWSISEALWESEALAVDGVLCDCIADDTMMISCEMDPPGGWIERKISLIDGRIIE